jgi:hypothetical protein
METIVDQLNKLREDRYQQALHTYSELMLRFDQPQPGDAEKLDQATTQLNYDLHHVHNDMLLIERYWQYVASDKSRDGDGQNEKTPAHVVGKMSPNSTGCSADAESIRHTHHRLFISLDDKK